MVHMNLVTSKASAAYELLFNKPASREADLSNKSLHLRLVHKLAGFKEQKEYFAFLNPLT